MEGVEVEQVALEAWFETLSERQQLMVKALEEDPELTVMELAGLLGVSRVTVMEERKRMARSWRRFTSQ
jgi:DNA-directed RNA polymerase specialized sigma subunit